MKTLETRFRICIEHENKIYKITSIYLLADGSFKVDVPYCKHDRGLLQKIRFPDKEYSRMRSFVPRNQVQEFLVKNRPQLSIPSSGFVQFSGPGIKSGFNRATGEPKGLGLWSVPLTRPVRSGPTCGTYVWGISKGFERLETPQNFDIIYKDNEFTQRFFDGDVETNSYQIEIWVFPPAHYRSAIWTNFRRA